MVYYETIHSRDIYVDQLILLDLVTSTISVVSMPPRGPKLPFRSSASSYSGSLSKPASSHKPFATVKSTTGWSSASTLATMRHPADMTGEELGAACVAAAREQVDYAQFWKLIADRGIQLSESMEPREIALLLNGLSRTRRLASHLDLITQLGGTIEKKLPYFSSVHLAMTLSAISKSFTTGPSAIPPTLIHALVKELKSRVHELHSGVEIAMILNTLVKLQIQDAGLYQRLSGIVQSKLRTGAIALHPRELCIVGSAFAASGLKDPSLFNLIAERVYPAIGEATPAELARLLTALARAGIDVTEFAQATTEACRDRFRFMNSSELVSAVFAFGSVCEYIPIADTDPNDPVTTLLSLLKSAFISALPLFQAKETASVLLSFSRWRIPLSDDELTSLITRLRLVTQRASSTDEDVVVSWVGSVSALSSNSSDGIRAQVRDWTSSVLPIVARGITTAPPTDWQAIARAVVACNQFGLTSDLLVEALTACVVKNRASMDKTIKSVLYESLIGRLSPDADLMLFLRD